MRRVLITIDDLPLADFDRTEDAAERLRIVQGITRTLAEREVPFVAFLNLSLHAKDPALLPLWKLPHATLGNHTWSHPHMRRVGVERYMRDLEQGHRALLEQRGPEDTSPVPFRYPYLYQGYPCEQRSAVRAKLRELGSVPVPITIDGWDWYYSRAYQDALKQGDEALAETVRASYMGELRESVMEAEWYGELLFGREPVQILLLHGNALNAKVLGESLDWLQERGYTFVTLEETLKDPAYAEPDHSVTLRGFSHWKRLHRSRAGLGVCSPEPSATP